MRKYQIVRKPLSTATGEPGRWSFVAHGAAYTAEEAAYIESRDSELGFKSKRLPI